VVCYLCLGIGAVYFVCYVNCLFGCCYLLLPGVFFVCFVVCLSVAFCAGAMLWVLVFSCLFGGFWRLWVFVVAQCLQCFGFVW